MRKIRLVVGLAAHEPAHHSIEHGNGNPQEEDGCPGVWHALGVGPGLDSYDGE